MIDQDWIEAGEPSQEAIARCRVALEELEEEILRDRQAFDQQNSASEGHPI